MIEAGVAALAAGAALTFVLRPILRRLGLLDQPSARGLHARPVPRGAGLGFAAVFSVALALSNLEPGLRLSWLLGGLAYAALGAWDDWRSRSPRLRFALQIFIAIAVVGGWRDALPLLLFAPAVVATVWLVNLFNFMDGADGFAATQAVLFALALALAAALGGAPELAVVALALAGACGGFLLFNWYPASVFMGDAGSYFLGFQVAALTLAASAAGLPLALGPILAAPFVADATLTLLRRMLRGERWWVPHRTHAYQRLVVAGWTPPRLVLFCAVLNLAWCWPAAWLALHQTRWQWPIALVVYAGCAAIWYHVVVRRQGVATCPR